MWICAGLIVLFSVQLISGRERRQANDNHLNELAWPTDASYNDLLIDAPTARQLSSFETVLSGNYGDELKRARNTIRDSTVSSSPILSANVVEPANNLAAINHTGDQDKGARNLNYGVGSYGQAGQKQQGSYAPKQPQPQQQQPQPQPQGPYASKQQPPQKQQQYLQPYRQPNAQVVVRPLVASWSRNKGYATDTDKKVYVANNRQPKVYLRPAVRPYAPAPPQQVPVATYYKSGQLNYAPATAQPLGYVARRPKASQLAYKKSSGRPKYNYGNESPPVDLSASSSSSVNLPDDLYAEENGEESDTDEDEEEEHGHKTGEHTAEKPPHQELDDKVKEKEKEKEKKLVNLINAKVAKLDAEEAPDTAEKNLEQTTTRVDQGEAPRVSSSPDEAVEQQISTEKATPTPESSTPASQTEEPQSREAAPALTTAANNAEQAAATITPEELTTSQEPTTNRSSDEDESEPNISRKSDSETPDANTERSESASTESASDSEPNAASSREATTSADSLDHSLDNNSSNEASFSQQRADGGSSGDANKEAEPQEANGGGNFKLTLNSPKQLESGNKQVAAATAAASEAADKGLDTSVSASLDDGSSKRMASAIENAFRGLDNNGFGRPPSGGLKPNRRPIGAKQV